MDNLSELSKPVAEIRKHYPLGIDAPASAFFQPLEGLSSVNFGDLLYSQEYVSALLADNEALKIRVGQQQSVAANNLEMFRKADERAETLLAELEAKDKRIAELEAIRGAAEKLVRCKGRYHSEQNYRALAALFGVTTPDLPPVDGDGEAVIAELRAKLSEMTTFRDNAVKKNKQRWEELLELRAKLATPVRLPKYEDYNDAGAASAAISDCEIAIRAAGFKVMGDEQC